MKSQSEKWIASSVIIMSLMLIVILAMVLGKFSMETGQRKVMVHFSGVTGINVNSPVKFAGAPAGRVQAIRVLPRSKQKVRLDGSVFCVQIDLEVDRHIELGNDIRVAIDQDGLLGSKFIAIIPGRPDAPLLPDGTVLEGEDQVELTDLAGPVQAMVRDIQPITQKLSVIAGHIDQTLPRMIDQIDELVGNTNSLVGAIGTEEGKDQLRRTIANMRVISDNLKVVSTHAKGITSTLGEKPWRMIWGGEPNELPSEEEILKSSKPLPIRPAGGEASAGESKNKISAKKR